MTREIGSAIVALIVLLLMAAGLASGWWLTHPVSITEQPAPQVIQADASVILERKPDAAARPKQIIAKGAKVERVITITAQGQGVTLPGTITAPCPPVTVDLSLVRDASGRRVIASSPDGLIVGGVDVPVEPIILPAPANGWAAGLSFDPAHQTPGVWVERDLSRIRVGVEVNQTRRSPSAVVGAEARIRLGWVF